MPLSQEAKRHLEAYLEWRRQQDRRFELVPEGPMFLAQDPKSVGKRLGYKGLHKMVKRLGAISGVEGIHPHRFRHSFGTEVTRRGVDPLFGKELMGIKSDQVFARYTKGVFKQAAADAYLRALGEEDEEPATDSGVPVAFGLNSAEQSPPPLVFKTHSFGTILHN